MTSKEKLPKWARYFLFAWILALAGIYYFTGLEVASMLRMHILSMNTLLLILTVLLLIKIERLEEKIQ